MKRILTPKQILCISLIIKQLQRIYEHLRTKYSPPRFSRP